MEITKPKNLKKGDTIGIISLCGAIRDEQNIFNAKTYFENLGYNIVLSENIFDKKRYLAGEDENKINCLNKFFENTDIDAILCSRGGYGAIRIINKIDYNIIKNNPKIFAGYSDVTAFSLMFLKRSGLITFSSPMAKGDFGTENISEITSKSFFETLSNDKDLEIKLNTTKVFSEGEAEGILFGGNLATIVSLAGQDFIPDEKFIFFAEDLNEDVYKIDKMFYQLLNIDKFRDNLSGIILGDFLDITNEQYLTELFEEIAKEIKKPLLNGLLVSHSKDKLTIPIGAKANFNTANLTLKINKYTKD